MAAPTRAASKALARLLVRRAPVQATARPGAATLPFVIPASQIQQPRWQSQSHSNPASASASSVNADQVSHFNAMAADWWDPHGSSRLLHLMNPLRHDFIRSCLQTSGSAPRLDDRSADNTLTYLDIGCGGGIFAESAARLPSTKHVTAIDPTPDILSVAEAHARKDPLLAKKLSYKLASIEQLEVPAEGQGYDIVSLFEVIEHIDDPGAFLDKVWPFIKPGGWLVMSTITRTWMSWVTAILVAEDITGMVPRGTHDWNMFLTHEELKGFLAGKGWESAKVVGVVYVPGLGWKVVQGSEWVGNYFFAVRKI